MQHGSCQIPPSHALFTFLKLQFTRESSPPKFCKLYSSLYAVLGFLVQHPKIRTYVQVFSPALFRWITPHYIPGDRVSIAVRRQLQMLFYNLYPFLEVGPQVRLHTHSVLLR